MHGTRLFARQEFPGLIRRERQNRREHLAKPRTSRCKHRLRRTPAMRVRRVGVKPVFDHVMIDRRKLHRDELADLLIDDVKFVFVVGLDDFFFQF